MTQDETGLLSGPYVEGRHYCVDLRTGCWNWTGAQLRGYAHAGGTRPHRRAYLAAVGPIPEGYDLHHVCRNPLCVNPGHMEPVERRAHVGAECSRLEADLLDIRDALAERDDDMPINADAILERIEDMKAAFALLKASPFLVRAADRLYAECERAISEGRVGARSPIGDATLDYRQMREEAADRVG